MRAALLALVALAAVEAAAAPPRLVLVADEPGDRMTTRLAAEIGTIGFDVVVVPSGGAPPSAVELEAAARPRQAIAAVRVVPVAGGAEVWVADRVTGKTVIRRVPGASGRPDALLGLRAVELLRGSLLELRLARPPEAEVEATPAVEALVPVVLPARGPRLLLAIAPAVIASAGGVGPAVDTALGLSWMVRPTLGLEAFGAVPNRAGRLDGPEGRTQVDVAAVGAGVRWHWPDPTARLATSAGLGVTGLWLRAQGTTSVEGFEGRTEHLLAAAPSARAGLSVRLTQRLRLGAGALVGAALPWPALRLAGRHAADWGLPFVAISAGLEALLF